MRIHHLLVGLSLVLLATVAHAAALDPGARKVFMRGPCAVPGSGFHLAPPAVCSGNDATMLSIADATCGAASAGAIAVHVELVRATVRPDGSCANDNDYGADLECCIPKCE